MPRSPELYPQDQLVVDLSGLKHMEDELGVGCVDERDEKLGLALLTKQIIRLAHSGVQILNLSLGMYTADNEAPLVISRAIDRRVARRRENSSQAIPPGSMI